MIIVSQNKRKVINFDNIQYINVFENVVYIGNVPNHQLGDFETDFGTYKTEERAKEVLEEIQERYEHTQYLKCFGRENDCYEIGIKDFRYEMPLE